MESQAWLELDWKINPSFACWDSWRPCKGAKGLLWGFVSLHGENRLWVKELSVVDDTVAASVCLVNKNSFWVYFSQTQTCKPPSTLFTILALVKNTVGFRPVYWAVVNVCQVKVNVWFHSATWSLNTSRLREQHMRQTETSNKNKPHTRAQTTIPDTRLIWIKILQVPSKTKLNYYLWLRFSRRDLNS